MSEHEWPDFVIDELRRQRDERDAARGHRGTPCSTCNAPHPYDPKRGYRHADGHAYKPKTAPVPEQLRKEMEGEVVLGIARICPHCSAFIDAKRSRFDDHVERCPMRHGDGIGSSDGR